MLKKRMRIMAALLVVMLMVCGMGSKADAAVYKGRPISYGGKTYDYTKKTVTIMVNNKKVKTAMGGLILNNVSMVPANPVFKGALKAKYTYTASNKTLVLVNGKNTVKFVVNSKYAYVNGAKKTLEEPARSVTDKEKGISNILVPGEFTAKSLGYTYKWTNSTATSSITGKTTTSSNSSGNSNVTYKGRPLSYNGKTYDYVKKDITVTVDDKTINTSVKGAILENTAMLPAYDVFKKSVIKADYDYDSSAKQLILKANGHTVKFLIGKSYGYIDGVKKTLDLPAYFIKDVKLNKTALMVPGRFAAEGLGYDYEWINTGAISSISTEDTKGQGGADDTPDDGNIEEPDDGSTEEPDDNNDAQEPELYSVKIPRPSGIEIGSYTEEDDYYNKRFILTMEGDQTAFFKSNPVDNSAKDAKSVSISKTSSGDTQIVLNTSKIQAFLVEETAQALYVTIADPKDMYDKVVILDAGHGGSDPGASYNGVKEKNATLQIVQAAKKYFDKDPSVKVYYTRITDSLTGMTAGSTGVANASASLPARYNFANSVNGDLYISVHVNAATNTSARGTEVYYSTANTSKNDGGLTSSKLASITKPKMVSAIGSLDRGVKTANFAVIKYTKMPAILIETAFASNTSDAAILKNSAKIDAMGKAIYNSADAAFTQYPTKR